MYPHPSINTHKYERSDSPLQYCDFHLPIPRETETAPRTKSYQDPFKVLECLDMSGLIAHYLRPFQNVSPKDSRTPRPPQTPSWSNNKGPHRSFSEILSRQNTNAPLHTNAHAHTNAHTHIPTDEGSYAERSVVRVHQLSKHMTERQINTPSKQTGQNVTAAHYYLYLGGQIMTVLL